MCKGQQQVLPPTDPTSAVSPIRERCKSAAFSCPINLPPMPRGTLLAHSPELEPAVLWWVALSALTISRVAAVGGSTNPREVAEWKVICPAWLLLLRRTPGSGEVSPSPQVGPHTSFFPNKTVVARALWRRFHFLLENDAYTN